MSTVDLDDNEWGQVMAIIATAPWNAANPLLMKIGNQLQAQRLNNTRREPQPEYPSADHPAPGDLGTVPH